MTGIAVVRDRISASRLARVGARCCTSTKAMPVSTGSAPSICEKASRPPAEAPTPTIGKGEPAAGTRASFIGFSTVAGGTSSVLAPEGAFGLRLLAVMYG